MKDYQREFLDFAVQVGAIRFGQFALKSGKVSPYFFNTGSFNSGHALAQLGRYYAQAAIDAGLSFDMLYGPAYKGIALAIATAIACYHHYERDVPYAFNRKEAKQHGEGGVIVGAPLHGRVLVVDDVISSGGSLGEAIARIESEGASPAGVLIALDRQERGGNTGSAAKEIERAYGIPVASIVKLDTLVNYLSENPNEREHLKALSEYRSEHGA